jgi:hypothetical protein
MRPTYYRLTVIGCALAWFLLGAHVPVLHEITHHGRTPSSTVLIAVAGVALVALAAVVLLLRAPARPGSSGAAA